MVQNQKTPNHNNSTLYISPVVNKKNDLMYVTPPNPTTVTTNKLLETPGSNKSTSTSTSLFFHFDRASNHTLHDRVTDNNLLDDPLSAVDEHVGKHLTDHVLGPNGLLKSKCKILATNNIKVLSIADTLNLVSDGRLIEQGTYDDIMKQESSKIRQLIESFGKKKDDSPTPTPSSQTDTNNEVEIKIKDDDINLDDLDSECDLEVESLRRASEASLVVDDEELQLGPPEEDEEDEDTKARKEHLEQGKVKWEVYEIGRAHV